MIDLSFDLTPEEALAFWKKKLKLSPGEFDKLEREAKLMAFSVSGIARGAELNTVFNAITKAIEDGVSFDDFKKECAGIFERRGWTGKRAWRIDNIFRTNIQTAYNVGNYQQMMRVKERRPYWRYSAVNDSRTRPAHRAVHGRIFPADHPFWDKWFPPNGFRCRCSVNSVSDADLESNGWKVEKEDPTGGLYEPTDPRTGVRLPGRLLMPDPGWDFRVGKNALGGYGIEGPQGVFKDMDNLKTAADYGRRSLSNIRPADIPKMKAAPLPAKMGDEFYKKEFEKLYGETTMVTDPINDPVMISRRSFQVFKEAGQPEVWKFEKLGHGESIPLLKEMILEPFEIWLTPQVNEAGRVRLAKRYVALWKDEEKNRIGGLAVFEVEGGVLRGVTSFLPVKGDVSNVAYLDKQRRGVLLYKRGQGRNDPRTGAAG